MSIVPAYDLNRLAEEQNESGLDGKEDLKLHRYEKFKNPYEGMDSINLSSHLQKVIERFKVRLSRKLETEWMAQNDKHIALKKAAVLS